MKNRVLNLLPLRFEFAKFSFRKMFGRLAVCVSGLFFSIAIFANSSHNSSPDVMLQTVSNRMINYLVQHHSQLKRDPSLVASRIVQKELIPIIDIDYMAELVVGPRYWKNATPQQQKIFIKEFLKNVIFIYSSALASYNGDQIKFYPLSSYQKNPSQKVIVVRSLIIRSNGQQIPITYNLVRKNGQWKIYDFSIHGISLIRSYHSQFEAVLAGGGMPALLDRLIAHNRGVDSE